MYSAIRRVDPLFVGGRDDLPFQQIDRDLDQQRDEAADKEYENSLIGATDEGIVFFSTSKVIGAPADRRKTEEGSISPDRKHPRKYDERHDCGGELDGNISRQRRNQLSLPWERDRQPNGLVTISIHISDPILQNKDSELSNVFIALRHAYTWEILCLSALKSTHMGAAVQRYHVSEASVRRGYMRKRETEIRAVVGNRSNWIEKLFHVAQSKVVHLQFHHSLSNNATRSSDNETRMEGVFVLFSEKHDRAPISMIVENHTQRVRQDPPHP